MTYGPLPSDPALPQLPIALDARAMRAVFAGAGGQASDARIERCSIDRIKYRPGRNIAVSYILEVRTAGTDTCFEQRVAARFCAQAESARRYASAQRQRWTASRVGPAVLHEPSLRMLAHWWPNDAKLAQPALLDNAQALHERCLREVSSLLGSGRGELQSHRTQVVQYVPEHRISARVDIDITRQGEPRPTVASVYAKGDGERRGAATHALMRALSATRAQCEGRLRTPASLCWQSHAGLHWQTAAAGHPLLDAAFEVTPQAAARVGGMTAALHQSDVRIERGWQASDFDARAAFVAKTLAQIDGEWVGTLARLAGALASGARHIGTQPWLTLHGDLHPGNILTDRGSMTIIDLDSARRGPAIIELGAWLGDAFYRSLLAKRPLASSAAANLAFLRAYAEASGAIVSPALLAWSTAWHLLAVRAWRCATNLKPGRFEIIPRLLALALEVVHSGTAMTQSPAAAAVADAAASELV